MELKSIETVIPFGISDLNIDDMNFNLFESSERVDISDINNGASSHSILVPDSINIRENFSFYLINSNFENSRVISDNITNIINLKNESDENDSTAYKTKKGNFYNNNSLNYLNEDDISFPEEEFEEKNILQSHFENIRKLDEKTKYKKLFEVSLKKRRIHKNNFKYNKTPRLYDDDNIITKIKINFTTFNRIIVNSILIAYLKYIGREKDFNDLRFYPIKHKEKRSSSKKTIKELQTKSIGDITKLNTTSKWSSKNPNTNENRYEIITNDKNLALISEVLKKNYLFFFDILYRKKKRQKFNLKEFGFEDLEVELPKKNIFYEDLLEKNRKNPKIKFFEEYKTRMNLCCKIYFTKNQNNTIFKARRMKKNI